MSGNSGSTAVVQAAHITLLVPVVKEQEMRMKWFLHIDAEGWILPPNKP
jgi:hypothetical protein